MQEHVIAVQTANHALPDGWLKKAQENGFGTAVGFAYVDKGSLKTALIDTETTLQDLQETVANLKEHTVIFYFMKADTTPLNEDIQPFYLLSDENQLPVLVAFVDGNTTTWNKPESTHGAARHAVWGYLGPKIEKILKDKKTLKDTVTELEDPLTRQELLNNMVLGHGTIMILSSDGVLLDITANHPTRMTYPWGWVTNSFGYLEQSAAPPAPPAPRVNPMLAAIGKAPAAPAAPKPSVPSAPKAPSAPKPVAPAAPKAPAAPLAPGVHQVSGSTVLRAPAAPPAPKTATAIPPNAGKHDDLFISMAPPEGLRGQKGALRKWYYNNNTDLVKDSKTNKMRGKLPDNYENLPPVLVRKPKVTKSLNDAGELIKATGTEHLPISQQVVSVDEKLPIISPAQIKGIREELLRRATLMYSDPATKTLPDLKFYQEIEEKYPTFFESVGVEDGGLDNQEHWDFETRLDLATNFPRGAARLLMDMDIDRIRKKAEIARLTEQVNTMNALLEDDTSDDQNVAEAS